MKGEGPSERRHLHNDLQTTAENLAVAESSFTRLVTPQKSNMVYSSLDLLNRTALTHEKDPELSRLSKECQELSVKTCNNKWTFQCDWNEIAGLKQELDCLKAQLRLQTFHGVQHTS